MLWRRYAVAAALLGLSACGHRDEVQLLDVDGRSSAHVTLAAADGRALAAWAASGPEGTDVFLASSDDRGRTFGAPHRVNDVPGDAIANGEQPPRVSMRGREVVVVWVSKRTGTSVIRAASSSDGGVTFTAATSVSRDGATGARGWESAELSGNGIVHTAWLDGRNAAPAPRHAAMNGHAHQGDTAPRQDIYHAFWRAGVEPIETRVAENVCFCCKTSVVTRGSDVYVAWRHLFEGGVRDIAVAHSADEGRSFSPPVRVSADNWKIDACPDDGPAMAIDGSGALHIVWPTVVTDAAGARKAIFHAISRDGGQTFSPRERVDDSASGSASHPRIAVTDPGETAIAWDEINGDARQVLLRTAGGIRVVNSGRIGSYPSVAAVAPAAFLIAWTEQDTRGSHIASRVVQR